jgi:acid phosphatase (class A)
MRRPPAHQHPAATRPVGPRPRAGASAALAVAAALLLVGCQTTPPPPTSPEVVGEVRAGSGYLKGYLPREQQPNSLALLPPPPAATSEAAAADLARHRATRALRDTPRWQQARADVNLKFPAAAGVMACSLGVNVSAERTPHLNMLLRRSLVDAGQATYTAKDHYQRQRPFAALGETTCEPKEEAALAKDGSYPSGHAALGWAWALILAELAPDRAQALFERGHAFGDSRVVCGVHWQSDVDQGRVIGAAAVARLHGDTTFLAQMAEARREIAEARARNDVPAPAACAAEAAALKR